MLIVLRDSMSTFLKASENHSETNKIFEPIIVALYTHNLWIPFCDILLKDSSNGGDFFLLFLLNKIIFFKKIYCKKK